MRLIVVGLGLLDFVCEHLAHVSNFNLSRTIRSLNISSISMIHVQSHTGYLQRKSNSRLKLNTLKALTGCFIKSCHKWYHLSEPSGET